MGNLPFQTSCQTPVYQALTMYLYHKYCCNKETRLFSWGRSNPLLNSEEKLLVENDGNDLRLAAN